MNTDDISTDPARLQPAAIHAYLTRSDWSPGIPGAVVRMMEIRHPAPYAGQVIAVDRAAAGTD